MPTTDIYSRREDVEIHIQGGIAKAYGDYSILKVHSIVIVPVLKEEKTRKRKSEEEKQQKRSKFGSILQEACKKEAGQQKITYNTSGYTKDARAYIYNYDVTEYIR